MANLTALSLQCTELDSGGATLVAYTTAITPPTAPLGQYRPSGTFTVAGATCTNLRPRWQISFGSGVAVDITIRMGVPTTEQSPVTTSPILPPIGTPAATTRAVDKARITGATIAPAFSLLVQCQVQAGATSVVPASVGPAGDFNNTAYVTIDGAGSCSWYQRAAGVLANLTPITGSVNAPITLAVGTDGAGYGFARSATGRTNVQAWTHPSMDRIALGGLSSNDGAAMGTGTYQRFAFYTGRLLDTQVYALATAGSSLVASAVTHDSGTISANTGDGANGNVILLRSSAANGRYLQVDIAASGAAYIDVGRLVAGPLWRPSRAFACGVTEGRLMLDRRDRNPLTGAEFPVPALANPRVTRFSLPLLTSAELRGQHRDMVRTMGAAGDALWIPDTGLSQAELNVRSLWGAIAAPGEEAVSTRDSPAGSTRAFRITERV